MTSVRSPLRNFNPSKKPQYPTPTSPSLPQPHPPSPPPSTPFLDPSPLLFHLTHISKMIEDSVLKFTKKYLILSTELEEMKREFISHSALISEYLTLTKKELRFDKFDSYKQGKHFTAARNYPLYEQKLLHNSLKNKQDSSKKSLIISTYNSHNSSNSRIFSPEIGRSSCSKYLNNVTISASDLNLYTNSSVNSTITNNNNHNESKHKSGKLNKKKNVVVNNVNSHMNQHSVLYYNNAKSEKRTSSFKKGKSGCSNKKIYTKLTVDMNDKEKSDYHDSILDTIKSNNIVKGMYYIINKTDFLPYEDSINACYINHEIASRIIPKNIVYDNVSRLECEMNKLISLQNEEVFHDKDELINKALTYPSRTAISGLNYLTNEREQLLFTDETMAYTLYEMICKVLGNESNERNDSTNIQMLFEDMYTRYNVSSLKQLFKDVIYEKVYSGKRELSQNESSSIVECIENNKDVITDNLVTNNNKTFSYIAFSLEEICEYLKLMLQLQENDLLMKKYIRSKRINEIENELIELNKKISIQ